MVRYMVVYVAMCVAIPCADPQPASSATPSGQNQSAYQRDKDGALVPRMGYTTFLDRSCRFILHDLDNGWASGNAYRDRDGKAVPGYVNYALVNPRRQLGVGHPLNADTVYPAFHHALFIRTLLAHWRRTGDAECLNRARQLADWNLQRRTPADCRYGSLFYSTVHKGIVGGNVDGDALMTDKPAIMALAMLELAQATGEKRYREAAEAVADTLAKTQLPAGNWSFRVNPRTGAVREAYTSSAIYAVMLFETLGPGKEDCWAKARARALKWILDGPVKTMRWNGFYEDVSAETGKENRTNWDCIDTARWLVAHRSENAEYLPLAMKLHDWIAKEFVEKNAAWAPAEGLREQKCCFQTMGIHTAHWAALLADLHAATGNASFKQRTLDSCALVTYWMRDDGANLVGPTWGDEIWFSCHFGTALYVQDALSRFPALLGPEKHAAAVLGQPCGSPLPVDCPIERSAEFSEIMLTGRHAQYGNADTWYPSWAADGNLYSPWTDGYLLEGTDGRQQVPFDEKHPVDACNSVDFLGRKAATAQAKIVGDDPLHLKIINLPPRIEASPVPYEGRYPCGSLVYNGVWYYGTYALTNNKKSDCGGVGWTLLGPFVGFRWSADFGKTWTETPCTPAKPLFGEDPKRAPVKIGSPHFVDFGRNMEHSPDGYAYLVAHGSTRDEAWNNWIQGDQVYLLRVKPSVETMNDVAAYEFFAGRDTGGKPIWSKSFAAIKPLLEWKGNLGCVTATYNAGLKKYLMCVSRSVRVQHANALFLESSEITGPWSVVAYLKDFGPENYFLNIPSKFISRDGKSVWLCHSGNWCDHVEVGGAPPGSHYALCLREMRLVSPKDK